MEQSGTSDISKPDLIITLVHGTWPRGLPLVPKWPDKRPLWFEEGSGFRSNLEFILSGEGLRFLIRSHEWSGANSVYARSNAAQRLGETLKSAVNEYPAATQAVIGHSHGGNVALLSLNGLPDNHGEIHLITLATPFLE